MNTVRNESMPPTPPEGTPRRPAGLLATLCLLVCGLLPATAQAAPPTPRQPVASPCVTIGGQCYVGGPFSITSSSPGADHYRVCRSDDTTSWGGCNKIMNSNTGPSYTVEDTHLPGDGFRRAYYFSACDANNSCTPWSANTPSYVYTDSTPPTAPGATMASCVYTTTSPSYCWVKGNFTITVTPASDNGSGVGSYKICRSEDVLSDFIGCQHTMEENFFGTTFTVEGSDRPGRGSHRSYWFRAIDRVGNYGPWNTPDYVRMDYDNPTVSANNASSTWFANRNVTITAVDDTFGAEANSGLAEVRYRWNAVHNGSCTTGTLTTSGATLTVPEDDNHLYLCAKDNVGRVGFWNGGPYRLDQTPPSRDSLGVSSLAWVVDSDLTYEITVQATDLGSGVREVRALINGGGSNSSNRRGNFSWRDESLGYLWTADRVQCGGEGGGFASKRPDALGPTTNTLVGCTTSTSANGTKRTVVFTVKPNPTFGKFGPINNISFWGRDFTLNATVSPSWQNFKLNFSSSRPNDQQGRFLSYAGVLTPNTLMKVQDDFGIPSNNAFILYQWDPADTFYWRDVDTDGLLDSYQQLGAQAVLSIENILFERIEFPHDPENPDPTCFFSYHSNRFRLRTDWIEVLEEFNTLHGDDIRGGGVELILVASEVNNTCALIDEVEMAATRVKQLFPNTPIGMSYGQTYNKNGVRVAEVPPPRFPAVFDGIGIWSYNTFDPANPMETRNSAHKASEKFYNPEDPLDAGTIYGDLLLKLHRGQEVYLIFDAMLNQERIDLGWQAEDLGEVAENWAEFMAFRPEAVSMVGWVWHAVDPADLGMDLLPGSVIDEHEEIACRYFGLKPPGSTDACLLDP